MDIEIINYLESRPWIEFQFQYASWHISKLWYRKDYCKNLHGICWKWILCSVLEPPWQKSMLLRQGDVIVLVFDNMASQSLSNCQYPISHSPAERSSPLGLSGRTSSAINFFLPLYTEGEITGLMKHQHFIILCLNNLQAYLIRFVCDCDEKQSCRTLPNMPEKIVISIEIIVSHILLYDSYCVFRVMFRGNVKILFS